MSLIVQHRRPSVSFTVTLQHQLRAYQERFEQLRKAPDTERDALLARPIDESNARGKARALSPSRTPLSDEALAVPDEFGDVENNGAVEETSIGSDGLVQFYGKTSGPFTFMPFSKMLSWFQVCTMSIRAQPTQTVRRSLMTQRAQSTRPRLSLLDTSSERRCVSLSAKSILPL